MTVFERCPKTTLFALILLMSVIVIAGLEWSAKTFFGLGKVVLYDTHPLYGYRPQPNQTVARTPNVVVKTNNLGLRAQQDWDPLQKQNKVLFLGDSVTYGGSYIANDHLFSYCAVSALPGWESGNAGVNGWGVSNVYAFVKTERFLPATVYVSVFPEGDFYRGINRIGGQPFWTISPKFALEELLQYGIYQFTLKKQSATRVFDNTSSDAYAIVESAVQDLKALDEYITSKGYTHLIYITPTREQMVSHTPNDVVVKSLLNKHGLPVVYIRDKLPQQNEKLAQTWFHDNIHLSNEGHQQWAQIISQDLVKETST
jgi:hypothetical protein